MSARPAGAVTTLERVDGRPTGNLLLGDNLELLQGFPGEAFQLAYVDPPFDSEAVDREPDMAPGLVTPEKAARGKLPTGGGWLLGRRFVLIDSNPEVLSIASARVLGSS